jgi:hypothetical protein
LINLLFDLLGALKDHLLTAAHLFLSSQKKVYTSFGSHGADD